MCKSFTASRAPEFGGKRRRSELRCKGRATQGVTNLLHVTGLRFSHHFGSETDCLNSNQKPIQDRDDSVSVLCDNIKDILILRCVLCHILYVVGLSFKTPILK